MWSVIVELSLSSQLGRGYPFPVKEPSLTYRQVPRSAVVRAGTRPNLVN